MRNLKKFLALVLAMMMVMSLMVTVNAATSYPDSDKITDKYSEAIGVLSALGVLQGSTDGKLHPEESITREQFAAILYRIHSGDVNDRYASNYAKYAENFSDIQSNRWSAGYIGYTYFHKLFKGTPSGAFCPQDTINGSAILACLLRALGYDANDEFVGSNWEVAAQVQASRIGLSTSNSTVKLAELNGVVTREMIAELAYNTLNQTVVYWQPSLGGSYMGNGSGNSNSMTLAESVFNVKTVEGQDDVADYVDDDPFCRPTPTKIWVTADGTVIPITGVDMVWNTTKKYEAEDLTKEFKNIKYTNGHLEVYVDGDKVDGATLNTVAANSGNGTQIEAYLVKDSEWDEDNKISNPITKCKVVIINTWAIQLTDNDITPADADEEIEASITLPYPNAENETMTYETDKYEEGDVLLYTAAVNTDEDSDEDYMIVSLKAVSPAVTGYVSHSDADKTYIRVSGGATEYKLAKNVASDAEGEDYSFALTQPTSDKTNYDFYLDDYGYVVYAEEHAEATAENPSSYVYVEAFSYKAGEPGNGLLGGAADAQAAAKIVDLSNGRTSVVNIGVGKKGGVWYYLGANGKVVEDDAHKVENTNVDTYEGTFMKCTNLGSNTYALTGSEAVITDLGTFEVGKAAKEVGGYNALNTTTLTILTITHNGDDDDTYAAKTVTGYRNFTAVDNAVAASIVAKDNNATAIYVAVEEDNTAQASFAVFNNAGGITVDGQAYNFYVDGKAVTYYGKAGMDFVPGNVYKLGLDGEEITDEAPDAAPKTTINKAAVTNSYIKDEDGDPIYFAEEYYVFIWVTNTSGTTGVKTAKIAKADGQTVDVCTNDDGEAVLVVIHA